MQLAAIAENRKIDRTKTRQAVRAYFAVYRKYKLLLEMDFRPFETDIDYALPGYENAVNPDSIHGNSFGSREPRLQGEGESPRDRKMRLFCLDVEYKVSKLPKYQAAIIRRLYMSGDPVPTDREVYTTLYDESGYYVSERYYHEQKAKAIMTLAAAFRIEQYQE